MLAGQGCMSAAGGQPSTFEPLQDSGGPCWCPDSTWGPAQCQGDFKGRFCSVGFGII